MLSFTTHFNSTDGLPCRNFTLQRTKTPAEYPLYVQLLKQNGYSLAEIDVSLSSSQKMSWTTM